LKAILEASKVEQIIKSSIIVTSFW